MNIFSYKSIVKVERYQLRDGAWHLKSRESRVSGNMEDCQASWGELGDMGTGCLRSLGSPICLQSPPGCFSGLDCCGGGCYL